MAKAFAPGVACLCVCLVMSTSSLAENWPQWRGPSGNGISFEKEVPDQWSASENIAWKQPLPGLGTSTPIVWNELVFTTSQLGAGPIDNRGAEFEETRSARDYSVKEKGVHFLVQAHHQKDGHLVWEYRLDADDSAELPSVHRKHNLASPSVVTDGERVFAWMGTGQLVSLSLKGELIWKRHLGRDYARFEVLWGHGSSPTLYHDLIILQCDHPGGAYLAALDTLSGKERWKVDRGTGLRSYSTPFLLEAEGGDELIVNSSHRLESFEPSSGKLLWHVGEPVRLAIPMPVESEGVLYASRGYSSGPYFAVRLGGSGDVTGSHLKWRIPTRAPYISSLLIADGLIYMANERGIAAVVDSETGETLWRERLGGAFTASPVAADGKIYLLNELGTTFVLRMGRQPELVAANDLEERTLASPAIAGGKIYIRSDRHLFAIGQ